MGGLGKTDGNVLPAMAVPFFPLEIVDYSQI